MRQDPLAFQGKRRARREAKPIYKRTYSKEQYIGQPLTDRDRDIYARIVDGWDNKEIAEDLGLTYGTAKEMVFRVLSKRAMTRYQMIAAHWKERSWQAGDVPLGDFEV